MTQSELQRNWDWRANPRSPGFDVFVISKDSGLKGPHSLGLWEKPRSPGIDAPRNQLLDV